MYICADVPYHVAWLQAPPRSRPPHGGLGGPSIISVALSVAINRTLQERAMGLDLIPLLGSAGILPVSFAIKIGGSFLP